MTWAESWDLIKINIWMRDACWKFGYNTTPNIRTINAEIVPLFVANIISGQVGNEINNIVTSIENVRTGIHNAITDSELGIRNAMLTLAAVMAYPATAFTSEVRAKLRQYMHIGFVKTGTNWTFTNGNTAVTCAGADGAATTEFVVGQKCYLQGDDPNDAGVISNIADDNTMTLSANYEGAGGAGTIMRPETVKSRAFVRGAVVPLTDNNGNGLIKRYYTDEYGYASEAGIAGITKYECIGDPLTGQIENVSVFKVSMEGQIAKDKLDNPTALKTSMTIRAITADDNTILTDNVDFTQSEGAAGNTTKIPNWLVSDHTKFSKLQESSGTTPTPFVYAFKKKRGSVSALNLLGIGHSIKVLATAGADLVMKKQINTASLRTDVPHIVNVWCKGEAGVTGNVSIQLRDSADNILAESADVALANDFREVELSFWVQNVDASPLFVCLVRKSVGANSMYWSNFIFAAYDAMYNGCWQKAYQGQADFLIANPTDKQPDGATATDTIAADTIIQRNIQDIWKDYYLGHTVEPTITEPT
jgi:hypothetical protein